jgi:hypothetical protein
MLIPPPLEPSSKLRLWSAVYVANGALRRMNFEASDEAEARDFAIRCGAGLEGESTRSESRFEPLPVAYDAKTARRLLGGVSRSALYKELVLGRLERVPGTRRVLITRTSLEQRCQYRQN